MKNLTCFILTSIVASSAILAAPATQASKKEKGIPLLPPADTPYPHNKPNAMPAVKPPQGKKYLFSCAGKKFDPYIHVCYDNEFLCPYSNGKPLLKCGNSCYVEGTYHCGKDMKLHFGPTPAELLQAKGQAKPASANPKVINSIPKAPNTAVKTSPAKATPTKAAQNAKATPAKTTPAKTTPTKTTPTKTTPAKTTPAKTTPAKVSLPKATPTKSNQNLTKNNKQNQNSKQDSNSSKDTNENDNRTKNENNNENSDQEECRTKFCKGGRLVTQTIPKPTKPTKGPKGGPRGPKKTIHPKPTRVVEPEEEPEEEGEKEKLTFDELPDIDIIGGPEENNEETEIFEVIPPRGPLRPKRINRPPKVLISIADSVQPKSDSLNMHKSEKLTNVAAAQSSGDMKKFAKPSTKIIEGQEENEDEAFPEEEEEEEEEDLGEDEDEDEDEEE